MADQQEPRNQASSLAWFGDRVGYYALVFFTLLLPLFTLPALGSSASKIFLLMIALSVVLIAWSLTFMSQGIRISRHFPLLALIVVVAALGLAVITSPGWRVSLLGSGFELGTLSTIVALFALAFFSAVFIRSWQRMYQIFLVFFLASIVVIIASVFKKIIPTVLLDDIGILSGLLIVLCLVTLELRPKFLAHGFFVYIGLAVGIVGSFVQATMFTWILIGLSALAVTLYTLMSGHRNKQQQEGDTASLQVPIASIVVIFIAFFVFLTTTTIKPVPFDSTLSWSAFTERWQEVAGRNMFTGTGLNRLSSDIPYGIGYLPTFLITSGVVGVLALIYFLGMFLIRGIAHIIDRSRDTRSSYFILASFMLALFAWVHAVYGSPQATIIIVAFLCTGIFFASLSLSDKGREIRSVLAPTTRGIQVTTKIIGALLIVAAGGLLYGYSQWFQAEAAYRIAERAYAEGNIAVAEAQAEKAFTLHHTSRSALLAAETKRSKLDTVIERADNPSESDIAELGLYLTQALDYSKEARTYDDGDHRPWIFLAKINEAMIPLSVEGAYTNAQEAYTEAELRNPTDPDIDLARARLEITNRSFEEAKKFTERALEKDPNNPKALFLLSQLQVNEGLLGHALTSIEQAVSKETGDVDMLLHLGLVRYKLGHFDQARDVFFSITEALPAHANARYFLGLTYYELGQRNDALTQFKLIQATNPDNADVNAIVANLTAGRAPSQASTTKIIPR